MKEQLTAEKMAEQLEAALSDEFVATVSRTGNEIELKFLNGQRFIVTVWEKEHTEEN